MIAEILDAFGFCSGGAEGFEADDVIGTLADQERRDPVIVVSGDRDLLQVVRDDPVPVRVLYLGRGLSNATLMGPVEVAERYGVPADRAGAGYAELALLRGDPSDGLPGVPGIGEKTAATLLAQHGSLAAHPGRCRRPDIVSGERGSGQVAQRCRLHRGRRPGGPGGHRCARLAVDRHRRRAARRGRPGAHRGTRHPTRRRVAGRAAAKGPRRAARVVSYLGRPTS